MLIALGLGALATALPSFAQQRDKIWRIGFLSVRSRQSLLDTGRIDAFLQGLRELGYVEGKNLVIEGRYADGEFERVPGLAAELVRLKLDVIVTEGDAANHAAQKATATIPIIVTVTPDPVGQGLASSLARPGGNITGLSTANIDVVPKQLELMMTAVPGLSRMAVLFNPANTGHPARLKSISAEAQKVGVTIVPLNARNTEDIERAFSSMTRERVKAVTILPDSYFGQQRGQIAGLALRQRLPSILNVQEYPEAGGLMSYGADVNDNFRRVATFVDKILKGAKPGDLPFELPMRLYLVINRKTAKAIGLTIPQELLLRADRVIE